MSFAPLLGALVPSLFQMAGQYFGSKGDKGTQSERFPTMGESQSDLQEKIIGLLGPLLSGEGGDSPFSEGARKEYYERTVPQLAERFSNLGMQKSSSFNQALAKSGEDLSSTLNEGNMRLLSSLLPFAFQSQFSTGFKPESPSPFSRAFAPISSQLGKSASGGISDLIEIITGQRTGGTSR